MEHPTDDLLSEYALDPALVSHRDALEAHLDECSDCRRRLDSTRAFDALLEDADSWPNESLELRDTLLRLAERSRREDDEAEELLRPVLHGSSGSFVWANLAEKPKYHTGGVVRRLVAHADITLDAEPLYALQVTETAAAIASVLTEERYTVEELAAWRGTAWWMRANALRHLGRYQQAFDSLERAERYYRVLPRPELDLAAVTFARATILYEQEEYARAAELADRCARQFAELGQSERYLKARPARLDRVRAASPCCS